MSASLSFDLMYTKTYFPVEALTPFLRGSESDEIRIGRVKIYSGYGSTAWVMLSLPFKTYTTVSQFVVCSSLWVEKAKSEYSCKCWSFHEDVRLKFGGGPTKKFTVWREPDIHHCGVNPIFQCFYNALGQT